MRPHSSCAYLQTAKLHLELELLLVLLLTVVLGKQKEVQPVDKWTS